MDIYRTNSRQLTVETETETYTFLYNPDTEYVLVPATVYGEEREMMSRLRDDDLVEDVFNHDAIASLE